MLKMEYFNVGPTSASRRAAFETSIRQMISTFCIFCKCAGQLQIVCRRGDRLTPGGRHAIFR